MSGKPPPNKQCTADSKRRPGERCEAWAMRGKEVCYHHGGKSLAGSVAPAFKHGSRSKYLPLFRDEHLEHFTDVLEGGRYLELGEDIAALDTLVLVELERAKIGEGGPLWKELSDVWRQFDQAQQGEDMRAAARHLSRVGKLITGGAGRYAALGEVKDLLERKRKLTETERRRLVEGQRMLSATEVLSFASALTALVKKHVHDPEILARIAADVQRIIRDRRVGDGV